MDEAKRKWSDWDYDGALLSRDLPQYKHIDASSIFCHLSFNNNFPSSYSSVRIRNKNIRSCAFLRTDAASGWTAEDLVKNHPIVLRSFASFPPVDKIRIINLATYEPLYRVSSKNRSGVTVIDLLTNMSEM